ADVTTPTPGYDTSRTSFTGTCGSLARVTANDDVRSSPFLSKAGFRTVLGQDYYMLIHGFGTSDVGAFTLLTTCQATPANDLCSSPTTLTGLSGSMGGTNVGATGDNSTTLDSVQLASCAVVYTHYDTWYSYTP